MFFSKQIKTAGDLEARISEAGYECEKGAQVVTPILRRDRQRPKYEVAIEVVATPSQVVTYNQCFLANGLRYAIDGRTDGIGLTEVASYKGFVESMQGNCREMAGQNSALLSDNGFHPYTLLLATPDPFAITHFIMLYKVNTKKGPRVGTLGWMWGDTEQPVHKSVRSLVKSIQRNMVGFPIDRYVIVDTKKAFPGYIDGDQPLDVRSYYH